MVVCNITLGAEKNKLVNIVLSITALSLARRRDIASLPATPNDFIDDNVFLPPFQNSQTTEKTDCNSESEQVYRLKEKRMLTESRDGWQILTWRAANLDFTGNTATFSSDRQE